MLAHAMLGSNLVIMYCTPSVSSQTIGFVTRYFELFASLVFIAWTARATPAIRLCIYVRLYVPILTFGLISAATGLDPNYSAQAIMRWLVVVLSAALIPEALPHRSYTRFVMVATLAVMAASIGVAVLVPNIGIDFYGYSPVWRGVFPRKNSLAWVALLGVLLGTTSTNTQVFMRFALLSSSLLCLVMSGGMGNLATLAVLSILMFIMAILRRSRLSPAARVASFLVATVAIALLAATSLEAAVTAVGRDLTFTGRTDVWQAYLPEIQKRWFLGYGPGMFGSPSVVTSAILASSGFDAPIYTPHNTLLAYAGDSGVCGLFAFLALSVRALVSPFEFSEPRYMQSAAFAAVGILGGLAETHEVFSEGPWWLLFCASWSYAQATSAPELLRPATTGCSPTTRRCR
jgi:O-antigen ligase